MGKPETTAALNKILQSNTFNHKEVLKGLLVFLHKNAANGKTITEYEIAFDYFRRNNNFQPGDDTIVRVNIFKLRSLLEKYYEREGKKEDLIFEIPKGSYTLQLIHKSAQKNGKDRKPAQSKILFILLSLSLLFNLFLIIRSNTEVFSEKNPVWNDYIKNDLPVTIILGNPYFFRLNEKGKQNIIIRDITINSENDLKSSGLPIIQEREAVVSTLDYPYFSTNNIMPLPDLLGVFSKAKTNVSIKALSTINSEEIKRNNEICIANINSFGFLTRFLEQSSIQLKTNPRQIIIKKDSGSVILSVPEYVQGYYTDYAFLVKLPGPENNFLTFMGDFHASGVTGLSNYITHKSSLKELKKMVKNQFGHFPVYFEMVVKVTSYNYVDFKTELIYFNPLQFETETDRLNSYRTLFENSNFVSY